MHACWSCLFGYAVSPSYCLGMGDRAVKYIDEGHSEEFDACARALLARTGITPTPVKVLREIIVNGWRRPEGADAGEADAGQTRGPELFGAGVLGLPEAFGVRPP